MPAPDNIKNLVLKFKQNIAQYKSASYNETETRVEFLNPFWKELGWDVNNEVGYAINYRDVIHEDCIKLRGGRDTNSKAPDYAFRIGGVRKFFLEAKKPSVDIRTNISSAYQLRCYGWSCGLALSVLSDFEEFAVYDCRIRPKNTDRADTARIRYLKFEQYVDCWDEIAEIFHRENILRGSFDRFVDSRKSKAGTSEVDDEFLREIENWRLILARDLAKNHPDMDVRTLNFTVQRTIDRLIFLRMAEDRGIEPEDQLWDLIQKPEIYKNLLEVFCTADEKYNSGFFHFSNERGQTEAPDTLTPQLNLSDRALSEILKRVYPPVSPYRFDVLPVEILGNVYERFLGNIIRLTPARQVKVEEKPEVKKANGVFYTPPYIVDYIVHNTVGILCEGKTPQEVSALKILDPACGSGSFLLGTYKYLMNWHLTYYIKEMNQTGKIPQSPPARGSRKKRSDPCALCQTANNEWKLTLAERKRILLNNIYGVDLDAQAVEVTKLSLSLCVLEGFNEEVLESNLRLFYDRALPNLARNIRCGNSLIGPDYCLDSQACLSPEFLEEKYDVNAFDWRDPATGFGDIMREGGFDAVIGNPPYGGQFSEKEKYYLLNRFPVVPDYEIADYFIDNSHRILKHDGILSFIIPNMFMSNIFAKDYRKSLLEQWSIEKIDNLSEIQVFKDASVRNCIVFLRRNSESGADSIFSKVTHKEGKLSPLDIKHVSQEELLKQIDNWLIIFNNCREIQAVIDKINKVSMRLNQIAEVSQGLIPYDKYRGHSEATIKNRIWHSDHCINETYKKELAGKDVVRYYLQWNGKRWISYGEWLAAPRRRDFFVAQRILIREITNPKILAAYTTEEYYNSPSIINCINFRINIYYVLGIINSSLLSFYHNHTSPKANKGLFPKILVNDVRNLPIRPIDYSNPADVQLHDELVQHVKQLLTLNRRIQEETLNPRQRTMMERQISFLDRNVDTLVYQLYGLTEEEIRLVEK